MSARRRFTAVLVAAGVAAGACSSPAPTASNVVPPAEPNGEPLLYVAIGGDEARPPEPVAVSGATPGTTTTTSAAETFVASWVHRAFARLPVQATHVDLSRTGATAEETVDRQLPRATPLQPTMVSVWLGPGDEQEGTSADRFRHRLDEVLTALEGAGVRRIALLTRPAGTLGGLFAAEVQAAAEGRPGVTVVVLPELRPPTSASATTPTLGSGAGTEPGAGGPTGSGGTGGTSTTVSPPGDDRDAVARAVVPALTA